MLSLPNEIRTRCDLYLLWLPGAFAVSEFLLRCGHLVFRRFYIALAFEQRRSLTKASFLGPLIAVAGNDILRDQGEANGRKLDEAGVPVTLVRYEGTIRDFGLLNALAGTSATKSLFLYTAAELKRYLY